MARGKKIKIRNLEPDTKYKSKVVAKLINMVMMSGKKSVAKSIVYGMLDELNEDQKESRRIFEEAIKNIMPEFEVRSRRVGGANYQIPMPLKHPRAEALALRWLIDASRSAKGVPMHKKLLNEIRLASKNEGNSIKKKLDTHRMAEANKAFAHFAW